MEGRAWSVPMLSALPIVYLISLQNFILLPEQTNRSATWVPLLPLSLKITGMETPSYLLTTTTTIHLRTQFLQTIHHLTPNLISLSRQSTIQASLQQISHPSSTNVAPSHFTLLHLPPRPHVQHLSPLYPPSEHSLIHYTRIRTHHSIIPSTCTRRVPETRWSTLLHIQRRHLTVIQGRRHPIAFLYDLPQRTE